MLPTKLSVAQALPLAFGKGLFKVSDFDIGHNLEFFKIWAMVVAGGY